MKRRVSTLVATLTFLKGPWRVLTNNPTIEETQWMDKFKEGKQPIQTGFFRYADGSVTPDYFMQVETSDWVYPALDRLTKAGIKYRLGMINNSKLGEQVEKGRYNIPELINSSTFAWANASHTFFLMVDSEDKNFTLSALGLEALDSKKTTKRLQEITRITQMHLSGDMSDISMKMLTQADLNNQPELFFDGVIAIRKTFAVKSCFAMPDGYEKRKKIAKINRKTIGRLIARLTCEFGLIKGLAIVCDDDQLDADIVFHESALKKELFTNDGRWHFTAFEHPHLHTATWDMQTMFNNHTWLMTEERFSSDLNLIIRDYVASLEDGKLPDWLLERSPTAHGDDSVPATTEHITDAWKKAYQRWQIAGLDIGAAANISHMAFGSLVNQMKSTVKKGRWWVPMSNAFMATVNTWEALKYVANEDMPEDKRNVVFFDDRYGVVIPGYRFVETAELHDTWDQDGDQAKFVWIKLWSSNDVVTQVMKDSCVIDKDLVVPATESEAIDMCVVIRSPNGPGGYSIERFDAETMPWLRKAEDRIQVIDLGTATAPMPILLQNVKTGKIPTSAQHTGHLMSRDNALGMLLAQLDNPGVGRYANLVMAWSAIFGPSYPTQLPANGNDIIDALQQTADPASFGYIADGVEYAETLLLRKAEELGVPVDSFVFQTRFSGVMKQRMHNHTTIDGDKELSKLVVPGKFARMHEAYLKTVNELQDKLNVKSFQNRLESDTRNKVMNAVTLREDVAQWAFDFFLKYDNKLRAIDAKYRQKLNRDIDRFQRAFIAYARTNDVNDVIAEMYSEITSYPSGVPEKWAVALYRWIIDPALTRTRYGKSDRIIFQGGKPNQPTIMDLLIQGIKNL